jgi:hypothetical protein
LRVDIYCGGGHKTMNRISGQNRHFAFNVDPNGTNNILKNFKGSDKINPKLIRRIILKEIQYGRAATG